MELLACVKKIDSKSKEVYTFPVEREKAERENIPHLTIACLCVNHEIKILVNRRSLNRSYHPREYTPSIGGHLDYGDNVLTKMKDETKEELGLDTINLKPLDIVPAEFTLLSNDGKIIDRIPKPIPSPESPAHYALYYVVLVEGNLVIDPNEMDVNESKFVGFDELKKKWRKLNLTPNSRKAYSLFFATFKDKNTLKRYISK